MLSYPELPTEFPDQWNRLVESQGEPLPTRASKNGKTADKLEEWADACMKKVPYYLGRAEGDGFWEAKVHWFEMRAQALRDDASALRKEVRRETAAGRYVRPSILRDSGAIHPLSPPPQPGSMTSIERKRKEREEMVNGPGPIPFQPFSPPRKIKKEEEDPSFRGTSLRKIFEEQTEGSSEDNPIVLE